MARIFGTVRGSKNLIKSYPFTKTQRDRWTHACPLWVISGHQTKTSVGTKIGFECGFIFRSFQDRQASGSVVYFHDGVATRVDTSRRQTDWSAQPPAQRSAIKIAHIATTNHQTRNFLRISQIKKCALSLKCVEYILIAIAMLLCE